MFFTVEKGERDIRRKLAAFATFFSCLSLQSYEHRHVRVVSSSSCPIPQARKKPRKEEMTGIGAFIVKSIGLVL